MPFYLLWQQENHRHNSCISGKVVNRENGCSKVLGHAVYTGATVGICTALGGSRRADGLWLGRLAGWLTAAQSNSRARLRRIPCPLIGRRAETSSRDRGRGQTGSVAGTSATGQSRVVLAG